MSRYVYTLKDKKGRDYQGVIEAKDRREAETKLDTTGYYLTSIKKETQWKALLFSTKVTRGDVIVFSRQLATMIGAGLPIVKSLMAIAEQTDNYSFKKVIQNIGTDIESGSSFSDAISKHPKVFSEFFVSMVRAGETGGILDNILNRAAVYLQKEEELRRKVRSAFAYPAVVSVVALAVVTYLVIFVVPVFKKVYSNMKVDLPIPTVILMRISEIVRYSWLQLFVVIILLVVAFRIFVRTKRGAYLWDKFKITMPLMGSFNKKVAVSQFVRSFGALMASGIPITRALNVSETITTNKVISRAVGIIRSAVNKGESISSTLKARRVFPPVVVQLVVAGEESGTLDDMLVRSADFLDDEIDESIKKLTVKLEPTLTVILAVVIGFIALAIYLPMFDIMRQVSIH